MLAAYESTLLFASAPPSSIRRFVSPLLGGSPRDGRLLPAQAQARVQVQVRVQAQVQVQARVQVRMARPVIRTRGVPGVVSGARGEAAVAKLLKPPKAGLESRALSERGP